MTEYTLETSAITVQISPSKRSDTRRQGHMTVCTAESQAAKGDCGRALGTATAGGHCDWRGRRGVCLPLWTSDQHPHVTLKSRPPAVEAILLSLSQISITEPISNGTNRLDAISQVTRFLFCRPFRPSALVQPPPPGPLC